MALLNSISKKVLLGYVAILILSILATFILNSKLLKIKTTNDVFVDDVLPAMQSVNQASNSANHLLMAAFGLYGYTIDVATFNKQLDVKKDQLTTALNNYNLVQIIPKSLSNKDFLNS